MQVKSSGRICIKLYMVEKDIIKKFWNESSTAKLFELYKEF